MKPEDKQICGALAAASEIFRICMLDMPEGPFRVAETSPELSKEDFKAGLCELFTRDKPERLSVPVVCNEDASKCYAVGTNGPSRDFMAGFIAVALQMLPDYVDKAKAAVERIEQLSIELEHESARREQSEALAAKFEQHKAIAARRAIAYITESSKLGAQLMTERRVRKERRLRQREAHSEAVEILLARVAFLEGENARLVASGLNIAKSKAQPPATPYEHSDLMRKLRRCSRLRDTTVQEFSALEARAILGMLPRGPSLECCPTGPEQVELPDRKIKRYWVTNSFNVEIWDEEPQYTGSVHILDSGSGPNMTLARFLAKDRGVPFPPKDSPEAIEWIPGEAIEWIPGGRNGAK